MHVRFPICITFLQYFCFVFFTVTRSQDQFHVYCTRNGWKVESAIHGSGGGGNDGHWELPLLRHQSPGGRANRPGGHVSGSRTAGHHTLSVPWWRQFHDRGHHIDDSDHRFLPHLVWTLGKELRAVPRGSISTSEQFLIVICIVIQFYKNWVFDSSMQIRNA